jgi:hypothetical protein
VVILLRRSWVGQPGLLSEVPSYPSFYLFARGGDQYDHASQPYPPANPAIASPLQSKRPAGRVAELGSLGRSTLLNHDNFPSHPELIEIA